MNNMCNMVNVRQTVLTVAMFDVFLISVLTIVLVLIPNSIL